jgi:hypothetical protein
MGLATFSTSSLTAGSHPITASYQPGSTAFQPTSAALTQIVTAPATTTTLSCNPSTIFNFATSTLTATVVSASGTPTGSINFTDNGAALGTVTLSNGVASFTYTGQTLLAHTLLATYVPSGAFAASSASCAIAVQSYPTTTVLVSSLNPSNAGQSVTFTATSNGTYGGPPGNPNGLAFITFSDGPFGLAQVPLTPTGPYSGTASYTTSALSVGTHSMSAVWNPANGYASSTGKLTQTVNPIPSSATLTANPTSAASGSPITLTATIAPANPPGLGTPTGSVTFFDAGAAIGNATLNSSGVAQLQVSTLAPGTHNVSAQYTGSSTYTASTSPAVQVVITGILTAASLTTTPNPSYPSQLVTFSATVSATPTQNFSGTVRFLDGSAILADIPITSAGVAILTSSTLSIGTHTVSAKYLGNGVLLPSQSNLVQQVVLDSSFSITVTPAKMSLQTQHHATFSLSVAPLGLFAGTVTLGCGPLPQHATCRLSPASVSLSPNSGAQTVSVYLDTSDVIGYASNVPAPLAHSSDGRFFAALFLPSLAVFGFAGRRFRHRRLVLLAVGFVAASLALGCSGKYPASVAPGTYALQFTGSSPTAASQSATLDLTVTP